MTRKIILVLIVTLYFHNTYANLSLLGIELNKSTVDEVSQIHQITHTIRSQVDGYYERSLDTKSVDTKFIIAANIISNKDNVVEGLILSLNTNGFQQVYNAMPNKRKFAELDPPIKSGYNDEYAKIENGEFYALINKQAFTVMYISKQYFHKFLDLISADKPGNKKR